MTSEEAIEILKNKMDGSVDTSYSWCEAIRLAIQALEKTDYLKNDLTNKRRHHMIVLIYIVCLLIVCPLLYVLTAYCAYCDPIEDLQKLLKRIRKRSWE